MTEYGLQMYSVRDLAKDDMESALRQVAEIGYKLIEFAGLYENSAEDLVRMLKENNLKLSGTHTGWKMLMPDTIDQTIAYHKALGNDYIIIPNYDLSKKENLDTLIDLINTIQPKLAAEGITLGYHNHDYEFKMADYGQIPHEEIEKRTSVEFEIDTYWAYAAGRDPIAELERLKHRIRVIHLKDGFSDRRGMALGEGTAPVAAVREWCLKNGVRMVVESETCQPTGIEEVTRCMNYLKSLEA